MRPQHQRRRIVFYRDYFETFFVQQKDKVRDKIIWVFGLIEELEQVPASMLKHVEGTDGLYEIRIQLGGEIFRIFCFFDRDDVVVIAQGFQKKSQKTPRKEIARAIRIKKTYESENR
jgi:phage-related protein